MTSFLCDLVIDFDAINGYEVKDVERLIKQIQDSITESGRRKVVVLFRSAHYLTTRAFVTLYDYIRNNGASNVVFVLVSTDRSRIFPPLLALVENESLNLGVA